MRITYGDGTSEVVSASQIERLKKRGMLAPVDSDSPAPICGVDFCQECGECLACYGEDRCAHSSNGKHTPSERMLSKEK